MSERKQAEWQQTERDCLLRNIALRIRRSLSLDQILATTVVEIRQFLQTDRLLIYRFDSNQNGTLVAESVSPEWSLYPARKSHSVWQSSSDLNTELNQNQIINDTAEGNYAVEFLQLMNQLQVKAKLVVPIFQADAAFANEPVEVDTTSTEQSSTTQTDEPNQEQSWGLLVAQQCSEAHFWQPDEVEFLEQVATLVSIAVRQAELFNQLQQQAQREQLLNQINRAINSTLDSEQILDEITQCIGRYFAVDRVIIFQFQASFIQILNEWRVNPEIGSMLSFQAPVSVWPDLLDLDSEFYHRRVFHAPDYAARNVTIQRVQQYHLSVLSAPIFIQDALFGGIGLHTTSDYRQFTTDEISLLEKIAEQAAIALCKTKNLVQSKTQELEVEKQISEAVNQAKTEFLSTMSHELRTPLNAILGLSQLLQKQIFGSLNDKQQEYISCIHSSGENLLSLINDILDCSRIEAGYEELSLAPISIPELCQYCLGTVKEQALAKGLQLVSTIDSQAKTCVADERRLKQMLLNLLSNAVKFTSVGQVSLSVCKQTDDFIFTIADTGIGIDEAEIPLLFQLFSQVDGELNRQYEGTGLGLALTRKLARLHGGDVTVTSTLGCGSQFTLCLPDLSLTSHATSFSS
ncbi:MULTISPECIES: GAF domain-containing sensor histidine kinase [Trichocoleus]|uniref:histidine kinase n=1 Tax=Trichocoleus desertorum GB2-A4 TaxID=2933944 RepID=A0ABV0J7I3_9CYAN|nr:GAF domain-containing protein [Trichocoleus sp. FACHB-46]MBD1862080.1 GAF domain-containing protein [Trichocoleus sp. FACHB-46]